jgi:hypothetical protein
MGKTITETKTDSDSIEVARNAKGGYTWTIKVYGVDHLVMLDQVGAFDTALRVKFPSEGKALAPFREETGLGNGGGQ